MDKSIVFMFSGQGSQFYNMGEPLYDSNSIFKKWMVLLNEVFQDITGDSVLEVLYNGNFHMKDAFSNLYFTHPAIFMVEYSLGQVLIESGISPDYVIGTSLGEFASSAISGVMDYEEAMKCIIRQASAVRDHCPEGGMTAVIGDCKLYYDMPEFRRNSELVSVNYHSHFVVSGSVEGLHQIEKCLKDRQVIFQRLPVTYAFHSCLVDPAAPEYLKFLNTRVFRQPKAGLVSCVTGSDIGSIYNNYYWDIVRKPILFLNAINSFKDGREYIFIDLGPSGTLANFAKYNLGNKESTNFHTIITPFKNDIANLEKLNRCIFT